MKRSLGKIIHAIRVLRNEGPITLSIITLMGVEKRQRRKEGSKKKFKLHTIARYSDIIAADPSRRLGKWAGTEKKTLTFNWLMPPPGKGSGGHLNIFRFIKFLEEAGHFCRIYLYVDGEHGSIGEVRKVMGDSYPTLSASMEWYDQPTDMAPADGIFATSWQTAYPAYGSSLKARRFYFVQDFEPYFYPVGSHSVLAENTYKLGLYGVTAGGWLAKKLSRDYGMQADYFNFGAEKAVYNYVNAQPRKEVLFYVRPFTERRGFEIGIMALDLFYRKHPDYIINLAGWDVSDYELPFPYENLKTLEISQLNELYNRCAAGLVLSFTNMSLLPLELLSSGTIPVVNEGENNNLVSNNKFISYSQDTPQALADALSEVVSRPAATEYAKRASVSVDNDDWGASGKRFLAIVERETRNNE